MFSKKICNFLFKIFLVIYSFKKPSHINSIDFLVEWLDIGLPCSCKLIEDKTSFFYFLEIGKRPMQFRAFISFLPSIILIKTAMASPLVKFPSGLNFPSDPLNNPY